uniref:Uncharacterized protein n=1 Tax=Rhizophora mucronata TaxID=61149 RepID=A0A2P2N763_RHIMU
MSLIFTSFLFLDFSFPVKAKNEDAASDPETSVTYPNNVPTQPISTDK